MYPPQHVGGYELAWQQAMRHARALGHHVRVLTSDYAEEPRRDEEDPDVHRTLRWYWDLERYEFPKLGVIQRLALERHNAAELRRHLREFAPDLVAWWPMGCMSLSLIEQVRQARIPAVFVVHDDWLVYGWDHDQWMRIWSGQRRRKLGRIVERVCRIPVTVDLENSGAWVFNSRYTLERARATGLDVPAMSVVYPGIEARFLEPLEPTPWRWRLAYVGRIDRQKGVDTAVEALAQLPPEATLTIWGSGDEHYIAEMNGRADRLGVAERVDFRGFARADQLRAVYQDTDVVVFPVRWNEPFGLVPLEAMGLGRLVVTTSRGGTAEFVQDERNALVFPAGDAGALARCVKRLGDDEALRLRLREDGFRTAARYPASAFAERTVEQMLRVIERPPAVDESPVAA